MRIGVRAGDDQWQALNNQQGKVDCFRLNSDDGMSKDLDAYLLLSDGPEFDFTTTSKPIFINSVNVTLTELNAPINVLRINGWNSFLTRNTWEISGTITDAVLQIFLELGKQLVQVPDVPGFVSARVIAMIINEAYFTLEDKVSTKEEIDIAMKLGTNYPYGPFEWSALIGADKIFALLQKLSLHDKRYSPSKLLKEAATI